MAAKKITILLMILSFSVIGILGTVFFSKAKPSTSSELTLAYLADNPLWVKLAETPHEIQQGLSGVKQLAEDQGMLFILSSKQRPVFWMYQMNFPLDLIWIANGKVVDLTENLPAPTIDTPTEQIARCQPKTPVDMVLEVNAGWVAAKKIKLGDSFFLATD